MIRSNSHGLILSYCYTVNPERTNIEKEGRHLKELLQNWKIM